MIHGLRHLTIRQTSYGWQVSQVGHFKTLEFRAGQGASGDSNLRVDGNEMSCVGYITRLGDHCVIELTGEV